MPTKTRSCSSLLNPNARASFRRIADWAEIYHPPTPEPLKLSASAVDSYRKCPQLFLFSRLWSLKEGPAATLSFGAVMHTTVRRFIDQYRKGVKLPFEEVARVFETEWTSAGYEDEYQESEYKKDGIEQLRVFHAAFLADPPEVLEQEKAFELPLENNVIINGRIDQINSLGKKDVEIIDYKTGKVPQRSRRAPRSATQHLRHRRQRNSRAESRPPRLPLPAEQSGPDRPRAPTNNSTKRKKLCRKPPPTSAPANSHPSAASPAAAAPTNRSAPPTKNPSALIHLSVHN